MSAVASQSSPAQVVGVGQVCGELHFSVQLLYSHDVLGTFVSDFARPEHKGTLNTTFDFYVHVIEWWRFLPFF